jgi:prepilin-type N-terminal cleavage/methylation domain-containing protein
VIVPKRYQEGVTLLEVLLVLTIAASFAVLGLRQYQNFRLDADILELRKNVDTLFLSAANYYWANCSAGHQLDIVHAPGTTKAINISTDLIQGGYLSSSFPTSNALVNNTSTNGGYVVQFNKYTDVRYQSVCSNPPSCSSTVQTPIGTIILWRIQVSVLMQNTTTQKLTNAKNYLSANCLSTSSGTTVVPCTSATSTGTYVVFERMPSYPTSDWSSQSTFWPSNPLVQQFDQMYTTNPITNLTTVDHTAEYQYFYCNG